MQKDLLRGTSRIWTIVVAIAAVGCGHDGYSESDIDYASASADTISGDGVRGGALYDRWWSVTGAAEPMSDHPLWASRPDTLSNTRAGADTWRCKECHGWDYEGVDGAYGEGSHKTGIAGVGATLMTPSEIVALLEDPDGHDYGSVLSEQDLADLAIFITEWTTDPIDIIDASGVFKGKSNGGAKTFAMRCSGCHGANGLATPPGAKQGFGDFPGLVADDNPWEFLHKVRFGQPGAEMPAQAMALDRQELSNLGAFAQTLPETSP